MVSGKSGPLQGTLPPIILYMQDIYHRRIPDCTFEIYQIPKRQDIAPSYTLFLKCREVSSSFGYPVANPNTPGSKLLFFATSAKLQNFTYLINTYKRNKSAIPAATKRKA